MDFSRFFTSCLLVTGVSLPLVLAHSEIISSWACIMSISGGCLIYLTIILFANSFRSNESDEF